MKKIKCSQASMLAKAKCLRTRFSRPDPEFFRDMFKLTYSSFTNYLGECAKFAAKYTAQ